MKRTHDFPSRDNSPEPTRDSCTFEKKCLVCQLKHHDKFDHHAFAVWSLKLRDERLGYHPSDCTLEALVLPVANHLETVRSYKPTPRNIGAAIEACEKLGDFIEQNYGTARYVKESLWEYIQTSSGHDAYDGDILACYQAIISFKTNTVLPDRQISNFVDATTHTLTTSFWNPECFKAFFLAYEWAWKVFDRVEALGADAAELQEDGTPFFSILYYGHFIVHVVAENNTTAQSCIWEGSVLLSLYDDFQLGDIPSEAQSNCNDYKWRSEHAGRHCTSRNTGYHRGCDYPGHCTGAQSCNTAMYELADEPPLHDPKFESTIGPRLTLNNLQATPLKKDIFPFLKLPGEIRNVIYAYAFRNEQEERGLQNVDRKEASQGILVELERIKNHIEIGRWRDWTSLPCDVWTNGPLAQPPLTRVCRQIRSECLSYFYSQNTFSLELGVTNCDQSLSRVSSYGRFSGWRDAVGGNLRFLRTLNLRLLLDDIPKRRTGGNVVARRPSHGRITSLEITVDPVKKLLCLRTFGFQVTANTRNILSTVALNLMVKAKNFDGMALLNFVRELNNYYVNLLECVSLPVGGLDIQDTWNPHRQFLICEVDAEQVEKVKEEQRQKQRLSMKLSRRRDRSKSSIESTSSTSSESSI